MVSGEGHEVEIVDNGEGVLEKLQSENCRVILADIKIPGISDMEMEERLHRVVKPLVS